MIRRRFGERACPYCHQLMAWQAVPNKGIAKQTHDHILPQAWGGTKDLNGLARNIRLCCDRCNGLRAACGHCPAAMVCVLTVARSSGVRTRHVLRWWQFHVVAAEIVSGRHIGHNGERV